MAPIDRAPLPPPIPPELQQAAEVVGRLSARMPRDAAGSTVLAAAVLVAAHMLRQPAPAPAKASSRAKPAG